MAMDKILVEVYVPAASRSFDIFIPRGSKIHELIPLIAAVVNEETQGYYIAGENALLCDRGTCGILNINTAVGEAGLRNGSQLVLI